MTFRTPLGRVKAQGIWPRLRPVLPESSVDHSPAGTIVTHGLRRPSPHSANTIRVSPQPTRSRILSHCLGAKDSTTAGGIAILRTDPASPALSTPTPASRAANEAAHCALSSSSRCRDHRSPLCVAIEPFKWRASYDSMRVHSRASDHDAVEQLSGVSLR